MKLSQTCILFVGVLMFSLLACHRHVWAAYDYMDAAVAGDTIAYSPKMDAILSEDSSTQSEAYYLRINKVKRVEEKGKHAKTVSEYDRFGHLLTEKYSCDGSTEDSKTYSYDNYGQRKTSEDYFYIDGILRLYFEGTYEYKVLSDGMKETEIGSNSIWRDYDSGSKTHHLYGYLYTEQLLVGCIITIDGDTTSRSAYSYDSLGRRSMVKEIELRAGKWDTTVVTMQYDPLGRIVHRTHSRNGYLESESWNEWETNGQISRSKSIIYNGYFGYTETKTENQYCSNGLILKSVQSYGEYSDTLTYRYAYYP